MTREQLLRTGARLLRRALDVPSKVDRQLELRRLRKSNVYEWRAQLARWEGVRIGKNPRIFESVEFMTEPYLVEIGDNVLIAGNVIFMTHDASPLMFRDIPPTEIYGPIKVGSDVFIGHGTIVLPGSIIGDRVLVGVNTVVRGRIPSDSVVMGNPAKVVFKLEMARRLMLGSKDALPAGRGAGRSTLDVAEMCFRHFGLDVAAFDPTFYLRDELAARLADRRDTKPVSQKRPLAAAKPAPVAAPAPAPVDPPQTPETPG